SLQELGVAVLALRSHRVEEVRAIEARYVERRVAQLELLHDVASHTRGGGRRECDDRNRGVTAPDECEPAILRAKVVTPFRNAVCFVDDEGCDTRSGDERGQHRAEELRMYEALG